MFISESLSLGILFMVILSFAVMEVQAGNEDRNVVRAICLGDVIDQYGGFNSFVVIRDDPAIEATLVPSRPDYVTIESATRNLRVYMPRTYEDYVNNYNATIISDCERRIMKTQWIEWMADSVTKGSLGFLWLGSLESQDPAFQSWEGSTLADIAPVAPHPKRDIWGAFRLIIVDPEEQLMKALPWEESPPFEHFNTQTPKLGSSVLASTDPQDYPLITTWSADVGRVISFSGKFPRGMESWARNWRFFPQAMIYMTYEVADRELPPDPLIFERLTRSFRELRERSTLVLSIIDFAEKFGADMEQLHSRLVQLEENKREAVDLYVESDYGAALGLLEEVGKEQLLLVEAAIDAKDLALSWIYVTEWLVILGTLLCSSSILWTVMIKRRLYREAELTAYH